MTLAGQFPNNLVEVAATFALSAQESGPVMLYGTTAVALAMPTLFTGTLITMESADAAGTYRPVYTEDGSQYAVAVGNARHVALDPGVLMGCHTLKLYSNAIEAAMRTISVIGRPAI